MSRRLGAPRGGFTLVELLVVLTIIGILVVALVPQVKNAMVRAKESVVARSTADLNGGIASFAANHNGNYPGVMQDVAVSYRDHGLGDTLSGGGGLYGAPNSGLLGPQCAAQAINPYNAATPAPGTTLLWNGVVGGSFDVGCLAQIKNSSFDPTLPRFFDVLVASDALDPYPKNPFKTGTGGGMPMINIFQFLFDPTQPIGFNNPTPILLVEDNGQGAYPAATAWGMPDRVEFNPIANGGAPVPTLPVTFANLVDNPFEPFPDAGRPGFGPGEITLPTGDTIGNYFAEGDFAYVPILTTGPYANFIGITSDPNTTTPEDDRFKAGTLVTGYYLFGFGRADGKDRGRFEDAKQDFYAKGIPGFGGPGVDTQYELAVAALFNGAVYFHAEGAK